MKFIMLESNPSDARYVIDRQQICQTLKERMGTGGNNVPLVICFTKQRRAKSKDDFETWIESEKSNTINTFDVGGVRATTVIVNENENTDREEIL